MSRGQTTCLARRARALRRRNAPLRHFARARSEAPRGRLCGRPRLPLRLHARLVAALEGPVRGGRRPRRHAVPRPADRVAVVADGAEPDLSSRVSRSRARANCRCALKGDSHLRRAEDNPEDGLGDRMTREVIWRWVTPRWRRHLERLIERERPDAVVVFTVPMAHLRGIPTALRARTASRRLLRRRRADEPARVRRHGHRLQLVPRRRSVGVRPARLELGGRARAAARARRAPRRGGLLGRRPRVLRAAGGRQGARTSSSTATATSSGATGCRRWSASRRAQLADVDFALGGRDFQGDTGNARLVGDVPFNVFARAISAARVNLCITRRSHATVYASSSCRPVRARLGRCGDRLEPVRRHRALVRARVGAARRRDGRRGGRGLSRAARRSGAGRGDGPPRARARARRAHLSPPRPAAARRSSA